MRSIACLSVALCMARGAKTSGQQKFSPAEQEVLNVSQARRDASNRRDMAASARYVAEDYILSSDDGVLVTKAEYYQHMEKLPVEYDHSTNAREFVLRLRGDTAVINFRITTHEQFGDSDEDEYLPLGGETFFIKNDLGSVTFVRDVQGHVTGYTYHRLDAQEIHVKKIK